jgi:hypothetical protein
MSLQLYLLVGAFGWRVLPGVFHAVVEAELLATCDGERPETQAMLRTYENASRYWLIMKDGGFARHDRTNRHNPSFTAAAFVGVLVGVNRGLAGVFLSSDK